MPYIAIQRFFQSPDTCIDCELRQPGRMGRIRCPSGRAWGKVYKEFWPFVLFCLFEFINQINRVTWRDGGKIRWYVTSPYLKEVFFSKDRSRWTYLSYWRCSRFFFFCIKKELRKPQLFKYIAVSTSGFTTLFSNLSVSAWQRP